MPKQKTIRRPSLEKLKGFCEGNFYSDTETKEPWQPFEDYSPEQIEVFINDMFYPLARMMGYKPTEIH